MSDYRQEQEDAEHLFYLWHSLNALRGYLSAETFDKAAQELGLQEKANDRSKQRIREACSH